MAACSSPASSAKSVAAKDAKACSVAGEGATEDSAVVTLTGCDSNVGCVRELWSTALLLLLLLLLCKIWLCVLLKKLRGILCGGGRNQARVEKNPLLPTKSQARQLQEQRIFLVVVSLCPAPGYSNSFSF